jgi:hypothetical protein
VAELQGNAGLVGARGAGGQERGRGRQNEVEVAELQGNAGLVGARGAGWQSRGGGRQSRGGRGGIAGEERRARARARGELATASRQTQGSWLDAGGSRAEAFGRGVAAEALDRALGSSGPRGSELRSSVAR